MISLFLGGARSGKSTRALTTNSPAAKQKYFIATAESVDAEFEDRIRNHQRLRDPEWQTVETPIHIVDCLKELNSPDSLIVIDCLTVWLGNLMHHQVALPVSIDELIAYLPTAKSEIRLVSNEVGLGLVPESAMSREFRDHQGQLNQRIAALADRVEFLVAGIPMQIKPERID